MKKQYLVCKKCGKKGMARFKTSWFAGYECKYCHTRNIIAIGHQWGCFTPKGQLFTQDDFEIMKIYMENNGYIDYEHRYEIQWNDEKQGFENA